MIRNLSLTALAVGLFLGLPACALAQEAVAPPSAAALAAASELVTLLREDDPTEMGEMLEAGMPAMPGNEELKKVVDDFVAKFLKPEDMRAELTRLYAEAYTEAELQELVAFYRTPLGQKHVRAGSEIAIKLMRFQQARLLEQMPELQRLMMEHMTKKKEQ